MTELIFLGTMGEIEESSKKHFYHSSLLISNNNKILIDYGAIHKHKLGKVKPDAILITHAHPDHYVWLKEEVKTETSVYLTKETLEYGKYKPKNYRIIIPNKSFKIDNFEILAYEVLHSIRCPTVGFRIKTPENIIIIYNPDLVDIINKDKILKKVDYYIGDGACIKANLVRRRGDEIFGHTRITTQINWCKDRGIRNIIFTHLGKETIEHEEEFKKKHKEIVLGYDGMKLILEKHK